MIDISPKNTTPALAGGGELPAVAGFESARSANISLATKEDIARLDSKIDLVETRLVSKMREILLYAVGLNFAGLVVIFSLFRFVESL